MRSRVSRAVLTCGAVALTLGCASPSEPSADRSALPVIPASPTQPGAALLGGPVSLLFCSPSKAAEASALIGPSGGTLLVGRHSLTVPAGALSEPVLITATVPASSVNQVDFEPEGLEFRQPARLTLSYGNCVFTGLLPKKIVYTTDLLAILQILPSFDNAVSRSVSADIGHFSRYAVAW